MRLLVVHSYYADGQPSGENAAVDAEVAALRGAGHEVQVVAARTDDLRGRGYALRAAGRVATGLGRDPLPEVRRFRPDVVHVHNLFPNFGRRWVLGLDVPYVHTLHNYRPLCPAATLYRSAPGAAAGQPCTLCVGGHTRHALAHRCYRGSFVATLPLAVAARAGVRDPVLDRARRLVVLTETMRSVYARAGVDPRRMVVVPNFLPDADDHGAGPGGHDWLYVGRLAVEKGVLSLLGDWPDDVALRVVGSGPVEADARQAADGKRVRFLGVQPRREVLRLMRHSLGLVFPSRWPEGFPLVYAEALSAGLPVLAWPDNGVRPLVEGEGTGAVADVGALPVALRQAGAAFPRLRGRCRAVFEDRYTESAHVRALTGLYAGRPVTGPSPGSPTGSRTV